MRPANIVTAIADVLAGYAIAFQAFQTVDVHNWALIAATIGLYGGGVVLNDVFDAKLDAVERPERPIPSGKVNVRHAGMLGFSLLLFGCAAAFYNDLTSGIIALCIAALAVFYDAYAKHHSFWGPVNMGLCRGGNLLLGISANPHMLPGMGYLAILSVVYIAAVTLISRGEVYGGKRRSLYLAAGLYGLVIMTQLYIAYYSDRQFLPALLLLVIFSLFIFRPLWTAIREPEAPNIGKAVKAGVIALILMDGAWCMAFGYPVMGLVTLALMPLSLFLSKFFAVT